MTINKELLITSKVLYFFLMKQHKASKKIKTQKGSQKNHNNTVLHKGNNLKRTY